MFAGCWRQPLCTVVAQAPHSQHQKATVSRRTNCMRLRSEISDASSNNDIGTICLTSLHCTNADFGFRGPSCCFWSVGCVASTFVSFCISLNNSVQKAFYNVFSYRKSVFIHGSPEKCSFLNVSWFPPTLLKFCICTFSNASLRLAQANKQCSTVPAAQGCMYSKAQA